MASPKLRVEITAEAHDALLKIKSMQRDIAQLQEAHKTMSRSFVSGSNEIAVGFLKGSTAAAIFRKAIDQIRASASDALDQLLGFDRASRALQYATGNAVAGMGFVRKVSSDLGLDLLTVSAGFSQLAASAKGTTMEGQGVREIFKAVAQAATVLGLSADDTNGMIKALGQMMSKGKVQAEELRGQLGERLPGAFGMAAKAMGVTTQQLDKMLVEGKVMADEFLPKFAVELQKAFGPESLTASQSLQAQINRMKTAWTDLILEIGKQGGMEAVTASVRLLGSSLKAVAESGILRAISDALGNVVLQALALGLAIRAFAWSGMVAGVTAAVQAVQRLQVQLALANMQGITGIQAWAGAISRLVNLPLVAWTASLGAIAVAGYGMARWTTSYQREATAAAEAQQKLVTEATESTKAFVENREAVSGLEKTLKNSAPTSSAHIKAKGELNTIVRQLVAQYPDFLAFLKREGDEYRNVTGSMERYADSKVKQLKLQLQTLREQAGEARQAEAQALAGSYSTKLGPTGYPGQWASHAANFLEYVMVGKTIAKDAAKEAEAREKSAQELERQIKILETWDSGKTPPGPKISDTSKADLVTQAEHLARVEKLRADSLVRITLEQRQQADLAEIQAQKTAALAKLAEEVAKGKFNRPGGKEAAQQERQEIILAAARKRLQVEEKYSQDRITLENKMQAALTAAEEGGLAQRLKAIQKEFAELAKVNQQLGGVYSQAELDKAQAAAEERARLAEVKRQAGELKTELSRLAEIKGSALGLQELTDALQRFARTSPEAKAAAQQVAQELHVFESGASGWSAGVQEWLAQTQQGWQQWKSFATSAINAAESALANGLRGMFDKTKSWTEKIKGIWSALADAILSLITQLIAKWLVFNAISMATGGFGVGFAKFLGFAQGGIVTKPTLAMIGEGGEPEIVAPQTSFASWAKGFALMGAGLAGAVVSTDRQVQAYQLQASGYAQHGAASGLTDGMVVNDLRGAIIVADERTLADLHSRGRSALGRARG